jgi:hypothetical protein
MKLLSYLGLSGIVFVLALGLLPAVGAQGSADPYHTSASVSGCSIVWTNPSGTYSPGSTISAFVTTGCKGSGAWSITSESTFAVVAGNTFTCPSSGCSNLMLWSYTSGSAPLTPGGYIYSATFAGKHFTFSFTVSQFLVTNELPAGVLLGVLAPVAAVVGYWKLRKLTLGA